MNNRSKMIFNSEMIDGFIFQKEWEEYRRLRNRSFLTFFAAVPAFALIWLVLHLIGIELKDYFGLQFVMFVVWAVLYLRALSRFHLWECPRCHNRFFTYSFAVTSPIMLSNCRSCYLPKYSGYTF